MKDILESIYEDLKIETTHIENYRLPFWKQPLLSDLEVVDIDYEGKPFVLAAHVSESWRQMYRAANADGVSIEPFSGFRSYIHQKRLIKNKLDNGKSLEVIITETAIPGYSEHHSGRAIDICSKGDYQLSQSFEQTSEFDWLVKNAERFKFRLSYPRDNHFNIIYEPWHWFFDG